MLGPIPAVTFVALWICFIFGFAWYMCNRYPRQTTQLAEMPMLLVHCRLLVVVSSAHLDNSAEASPVVSLVLSLSVDVVSLVLEAAWGMVLIGFAHILIYHSDANWGPFASSSSTDPCRSSSSDQRPCTNADLASDAAYHAYGGFALLCALLWFSTLLLLWYRRLSRPAGLTAHGSQVPLHGQP